MSLELARRRPGTPDVQQVKRPDRPVVETTRQFAPWENLRSRDFAGVSELLTGRTLEVLPARREVRIIPSPEKPTDLVDVPHLSPTQERDERIGAQGCVVRALASILKQKPGDEEWQMLPLQAEWQKRLKQIKDQDSVTDAVMASRSLSDGEKTRIVRERADEQVGELLGQYKRHKSPLGEALRGQQVEEYGRLTGDQIKELIDSGRQVGVLGRVQRDGVFGARHMVHIEWDEGRKTFVAASDLGRPEVNLSQGLYGAIGFTTEEGAKPLEFAPAPIGADQNETMVYGKYTKPKPGQVNKPKYSRR